MKWDSPPATTYHSPAKETINTAKETINIAKILSQSTILRLKFGLLEIMSIYPRQYRNMKFSVKMTTISTHNVKSKVNVQYLHLVKQAQQAQQIRCDNNSTPGIH